MGQKAADIATIGRISAVPAMLQVISDMTGLRFAAVARVTDDTWTACAVLDQLEFGLGVGGELDLTTTICHEIRGSHVSVVIDKASEDPLYHDHHTPRMYHFESYISVPVFRTNGHFFGTICALDPNPAPLRSSTIQSTMESFARVLSLQIEAEEASQRTEAQLQEERGTAELREQFIAVLGHDLRTPLASIVNGAELIKLMAPGDKASKVAQRIARSGHRIGSLVDDLMDFARGRLGGGIPLTMVTTSELGAQLRHAVAELESSHPGRVIRSNIELDCQLVCDPRRLTQLLSNLLLNALTHGDAQYPIHVTGECRDGQLLLAVANQGEPIAPATLERLFHPFWRGNHSNPGAAGLGLGLYIASQIARSHNGELHVSSTAAGTVFSFRMSVMEDPTSR